MYLVWCKRCGNCVAFCPQKALAQDEWGYPFMAKPEACSACGLCQMLCPDFAISLSDGKAGRNHPGKAPIPRHGDAPPLRRASLSPEEQPASGREENHA